MHFSTHVPDRRSWIALAAYLLFTIVAAAGYGTFGRHPELLARFPDLASFYGMAFRFFAQAHVVIAALVLIYALLRRVGAVWVSGGLLVYGASLLSELAGTSTGLPFGAYSYSGLLGWRWFDLVPALIPLSWYLMAVPAYVLARHRFPNRLPVQLVLGAALLTAWDLALDPAMSALTNYWSWGEAGLYYGMPMVNLGGWMLTGGALMALMHATSRSGWTDRLSVRWCAAYYGITVLMPLGMLVVAGLWTGAAVAIVACGGLVFFALSARDDDARGPIDQTRRADTASFAETAPHEAMAFVRMRAAEAGDAPLSFFARHSRSFSFAARWFGAEERRLIAGLYAFCRTTDDLADRTDADPDVAEARLDAWRCLADRAYATGGTGIVWLDDIMSASSSRGVPIELAHELIEGVRMDLGRVRIRTWDELDVYTYRVASVVGIWMCHLFGVHDAASHRRATALGRAMQLTNILRDVGEDLEEDRIYLPTEVLDRYDITEAHLRALSDGLRNGQTVPPSYRAMMHEMIGRADALYEYAHPGLTALPPAFGRAAAVASEVYRGIHRELRRNAYDNLQHRAMTSPLWKVLLAGRALHRLAVLRNAPDPKVLMHRERVRNAATSTVGVLLIGILATAPVGAFPSISNPAISCPPLSDVRSQYVRAVEHEEQIAATRAAIEECDGAVYRAYEGALVTLKGKHAFWPPSKLKYVREGLQVLDAQVSAQSTDVEIRYLRLLSGYYLPGFLGRAAEVDEDFEVLAGLLPGARDTFPRPLYADMIRFVLRRGKPTAEHREALVAALEGVSAPGES